MRFITTDEGTVAAQAIVAVRTPTTAERNTARGNSANSAIDTVSGHIYFDSSNPEVILELLEAEVA